MGKNSGPGPTYNSGGQSQSSKQQYAPGTGATPGAGLFNTPKWNGDLGQFAQDFGTYASHNLTPFDFLLGTPGTPDFTDAAQAQADAAQKSTQQQTQSNRPGQNTPFGFSQWTQDANGNWTQNVGLQGGLADAAKGLQGQAAALGQGLDWSQFGALGDGSDARRQAIDASMADARRHLNPMFAEREGKMRSQLANSGLDPNSAAARNANSTFGMQRGDAYQGALNNAIMQGTQAQQAAFNQNLMSRQQAIAEALRRRSQPLDELARLQSFTAMPGFMGAGQAMPPQLLQALMAQGEFDMNKWQGRNSALADIAGGAGEAGGSLISGMFALSDVRAKENIRPLGFDAMSGVPFVSFDYRPEFGGGSRVGVIAQDVAAVRPDMVRTRPDGLLEVNYAFLGGES